MTSNVEELPIPAGRALMKALRECEIINEKVGDYILFFVAPSGTYTLTSGNTYGDMLEMMEYGRASLLTRMFKVDKPEGDGQA